MRYMTRYRWLISGLLFLYLLPFPSAYADTAAVTVAHRDATMTILLNGDVQVVETWQTNFSGGPFHVAFRAIQLNRVTAIDQWGISEAGHVYQQDSGGSYSYTVQNDTASGVSTITWYFPNTSNATRTFTLRYTLHGALAIYPSGDHLFWNSIEADRQYTIESSHVTVLLPSSTDPGHLQAVAFEDGNRLQHGATIVDGRTFVFDGGPFDAGHTWEIGAQFPHGIVAATPQPWQLAVDAIPSRNLAAVVLALLLALGGGLGLILLWYRSARLRPAGSIAPYSSAPPEDIPPGMAGTLLDAGTTMRHILATVVDLARRGFLQIIEQEPIK